MSHSDHTQVSLHLLTELQAARLLNVHTRTLRKARAAGELKFVRIGRCIRYTPSEIENFIRSRTVANDDVPDARRSRRAHNTRAGSAEIIRFSDLIKR